MCQQFGELEDAQPVLKTRYVGLIDVAPPRFNPDKRIPECLFLEFLYIVEGGNRVRYLCFWSFYRHYRGGPLINVFLRVYFDVFRQSSRFNFRPSKQSSFYVFGVFVHSRGRGNPCKMCS